MTRSSRPAPCSSPYLKMDLVRHPSFSRCIALLREWEFVSCTSRTLPIAAYGSLPTISMRGLTQDLLQQNSAISVIEVVGIL